MLLDPIVVVVVVVIVVVVVVIVVVGSPKATIKASPANYQTIRSKNILLSLNKQRYLIIFQLY